jgi:hypothetical protein
VRQRGVLQAGVDLLDDRVTAVDLVRGDRVSLGGVDGGEEGVEAPSVEQRGLPVLAAPVEVGIRRTTSRPVTCSTLGREVNAVNSISATSARVTQVWVCSSKAALVYPIGVQGSPIVAMAAFTFGSTRTVTETSAPPQIAAPTVAEP